MPDMPDDGLEESNYSGRLGVVSSQDDHNIIYTQASQCP